MNGERMETDRRRRMHPNGPCCYPLELWAFSWMERTHALPYIKPAYIAERPWRVLCLRYRDGQTIAALAAQADLWERGLPVKPPVARRALGAYALKILSRGQYGFKDFRAIEERARMLTTRFSHEVYPDG